MPCPRESHHAVDHATPGRCEQNQRHDHACSLCPVRKCRIVQMVATCPYIGCNQRPEVNDRQTVGINRTISLFGYKVVHHAQEAGSQEETNGIVPPPPLHHRIRYTCISGVGFPSTCWQSEIVCNIKKGNGDNECTIKPVSYINVGGTALGNRTKEYNGVSHPYDGDQYVNRPLQLCIFFR